MYIPFCFAVKSRNNREPDVSEDKFSLCYFASFEYPINGVCVVKAIIDDKLNIEETAKTLSLVDYDISNINMELYKKQCNVLNGISTIDKEFFGGV